MKQNLLNKLWLQVTVLVALMCTATGAWAQTYKLQQVTSVEAGGMYVFEQGGYVMNNACSSSALQTTNEYETTGLTGTETYVWTLEATDTEGKYYMKNANGTGNLPYLNNASSTNVSFGSKSSEWAFNFQNDETVLIQNTSNSNRFLGYTNNTSHAYKAYATSNLASYPHAIVVYQLVEEGSSSAVATTTTIDALGITNTDVYAGTEAGTLSATVVDNDENEVEGATVTWSGNNDAVATIDEETGAVTLVAAGTVKFTATYAGVKDEYKGSSATYEMTVTDSTPIPTHSVTFSVNGATTTDEVEEGEDITFPDNPADVEGKTFVGWVTEAIDGTTNDAPEFVTSATMGQSDVTFYAVFAYAGGGGSTEVVDVLNRDLTGVTGTSYTDWSDKKSESDAVYAGNSAGGSNNNPSIQLRSNNNNSGIVTTTSGGKAKKVVVSWNSSTSDGRTIGVYGSTKAYTSPTELYALTGTNKQIGTIIKGTSTELEILDDYEYIGIRSESGALYLNEVKISWQTGSVSYSDYCTTVVAAAVARPVIEVAENPFLFSTTATITCATDGAAIKYSFDGETWNDYSEALTITETTTIYAKAVKDNDESEVASVTITKNLAVPTIAIDATGITNTNVFDGTEAGSLAASVIYNDAAIEGAVVTWSGDNDEVATIDENGNVTLVAAGTVTFTATYEGNEDYSEKTATYEMNVTNSDPNAPGSEDNPYTVAEAKEATPTVSEVYIRGIVSAFYNTSIVGDGSNYRYYISDDGTTEDQLLVYKGKGLDNEAFSNADDLKIGDVVVIYGKLTTYQNAPEVAAGNYIVSLDRPVDTTPSIDLGDNEINAFADGTDGVIIVGYKNITTVVAEVFYCDAEGNAATYDWVTASFNGINNLVYVINENTSTEARTAYMKVHALDDEANDVYSELITINQAGVVVDYATLPFSFNAGKADIAETNGLTQEGITSKDYSTANTKLKFDNTGDYVVLKLNEEPGVLFFDIKGNSFSDGTFTVQTSTDGENYDNLKNITAIKEAGQTEAFALDADVRYIKWVYTEKVNGNVGLGNIFVDKVQTATVGEAGYATYVAKYNVSFPEEVEAYIATSTGYDQIKEEEYVSLTQVTSVAKGTPVVLKNEGEFTLTPVADPESAEGNLLKASDGTVEGNGTIYVLAKPADKEVGFYAVQKGTTVAEGKAYLEIANAGVKSFAFSFADQADGINEVNGQWSTANGQSIFNLAGQRIQKMQKGINIVNGKKVVLK